MSAPKHQAACTTCVSWAGATRAVNAHHTGLLGVADAAAAAFHPFEGDETQVGRT